MRYTTTWLSVTVRSVAAVVLVAGVAGCGGTAPDETAADTASPDLPSAPAAADPPSPPTTPEPSPSERSGPQAWAPDRLPDPDSPEADAYVAAVRTSDDPWVTHDVPAVSDTQLVTAGLGLCRMATGLGDVTEELQAILTDAGGTSRMLPALFAPASEHLCPTVPLEVRTAAATMTAELLASVRDPDFVDRVREGMTSALPPGATDDDLVEAATAACDLAAGGAERDEVVQRVGGRYGWDLSSPVGQGVVGAEAELFVIVAYGTYCPWQLG